MKQIVYTLAVVIVSIYLSGCSVGMALSGSEEPNLSVIKIGEQRSIVELEMGSPEEMATDEEGCAVCVYKYELGNEPSTGRAVGHAAMDVLTFGLWEIVGTPVEGVAGEEKEITIVYDLDGKVKSVR